MYEHYISTDYDVRMYHFRDAVQELDYEKVRKFLNTTDAPHLLVDIFNGKSSLEIAISFPFEEGTDVHSYDVDHYKRSSMTSMLMSSFAEWRKYIKERYVRGFYNETLDKICNAFSFEHHVNVFKELIGCLTPRDKYYQELLYSGFLRSLKCTYMNSTRASTRRKIVPGTPEKMKHDFLYIKYVIESERTFFHDVLDAVEDDDKMFFAVCRYFDESYHLPSLSYDRYFVKIRDLYAGFCLSPKQFYFKNLGEVRNAIMSLVKHMTRNPSSCLEIWKLTNAKECDYFVILNNNFIQDCYWLVAGYYLTLPSVSIPKFTCINDPVIGYKNFVEKRRTLCLFLISETRKGRSFNTGTEYENLMIRLANVTNDVLAVIMKFYF